MSDDFGIGEPPPLVAAELSSRRRSAGSWVRWPTFSLRSPGDQGGRRKSDGKVIQSPWSAGASVLLRKLHAAVLESPPDDARRFFEAVGRLDLETDQVAGAGGPAQNAGSTRTQIADDAVERRLAIDANPPVQQRPTADFGSLFAQLHFSVEALRAPFARSFKIAQFSSLFQNCPTPAGRNRQVNLNFG